MTFDIPSSDLYPTIKPTIVEGSYAISKSNGLYLAMNETKAAILRASNFKVNKSEFLANL